MIVPVHIDLKKDHGLTLQWPDGSTSFYPVAHLRRMSPSADMRELRKQMSRNPLTVLPSNPARGPAAPLTVASAELVGNYAIKLAFSDGHASGIFSWNYLRQIDPAAPPPSPSAPSAAGPPSA